MTRKRKEGGSSTHNGFLIVAPRVLSFSKNGPATLKFFKGLKEAVFNSQKVRRKGKVVPKSVSIELSTIRNISLPSAVILAAELHRWSLHQKTSLKLLRHKHWDRRVLGLMKTLGVFDLLGIKAKTLNFDPHEEVVLLPLKSGERRDGEAVNELQAWMIQMGLEFNEKGYVFGALDEAILNCIDHGYIDIERRPRYPYAGHRWWATSCFDPISQSLRFFVYDQGHGIPMTLPRHEQFWPVVQTLLDRMAGDRGDAKLIEAAFEVGRTRTYEAKRGKGLDKIHSAIRLAGDGYLRVLSGRGDIVLSSDQTLKKTDHPSHIGGTLVEWSIPIVALQDHGNRNT